MLIDFTDNGIKIADIKTNLHFYFISGCRLPGTQHDNPREKQSFFVTCTQCAALETELRYLK